MPARMHESTERPTLSKILSMGLGRLRTEFSNLGAKLLFPLMVLITTNFVVNKDWSIATTTIATILYFLTNIWIAVIVHRTVLIQENLEPERFMVDWSQRETRFLVYSIGIGLGTALIMVVGFAPTFLEWDEDLSSTLSTIIIFMSIALALWVASRLVLVLPAVAVDFPLTIKDSWELTRGHQWLMIGAIYLIPTLMSLPTSVIDLPVVNETIAMILLVIEVSMLSAAFRMIVDYRCSNDAMP